MTISPAPTGTIRFDDAAAYERGMGTWSRIVGGRFLDWIDPAPQLAWADIGCGNGASTAYIIERCVPSLIEGIDPSGPQIAYARTRPGVSMARFSEGDALALPYPDARFDISIMALVLFFVPDPARGLAEMVRVTRPGGTVCAYVWDIAAEAWPIGPIHAEMHTRGLAPPRPPQWPVSRQDALAALWTAAGLQAVETCAITVERPFADFSDYWAASTGSGALKPTLASLPEADVAAIREGVRHRMGAGPDGVPMIANATVNAVRGMVPR